MSPSDTIDSTLEAHLRARGLKRTQQREHILAALRDLGGHVTMDRTVKLFVEAGILARHALKGALVHYELVAPRAEHHDHLVCVTCGRIFEFTDPIIEARQEALAARHGMRVLSHSHVIRGECAQPGTCDGCTHCHDGGA
jgi:Fur family ferric uptake transcriptional regulator